jgi:hypothetical protein
MNKPFIVKLIVEQLENLMICRDNSEAIPIWCSPPSQDLRNFETLSLPVQSSRPFSVFGA